MKNKSIAMLICGLITLISSFTIFSAVGNAGLPTINEEAPGDEWAPTYITRYFPDDGYPVLLVKVIETPTVATYKVTPGTQPPHDQICSLYPDACKLENSGQP